MRQRVAAPPGMVRSPQVAWTVRAGGPVTLPLTVGFTGVWVVAAGEVLLVQHDGSVGMRAALDASTPVSPMEPEPLVGTSGGSLRGFSPDTGRVTLSWPGSGRARSAAIPVEGGAIWTASDGTVHSTIHGPIARLPSTAGELAGDGGRAFIQTQDNLLAAVDARGPAWRAPLPGRGVGSPLVCCDRVFVAYDGGDEPSGVLALDPGSGAIAWQAELASAPSAGMALAGDRLLIPQIDGSLEALSVSGGSPLWSVRAGPDRLSVPPLVAGESAWIGDAAGRLHRVDLSDGGIAWSMDLGSPITSGPELAWDLMLIGLASGDVLALRAPG